MGGKDAHLSFIITSALFQLLIPSSVSQTDVTTFTPVITVSNVTSTHDIEDPMYCSAFTWNGGWIAVATNAFATSGACCGRRVMGWKLYDDMLKDLKGKADSPPYCFFTKRLGSELVMKTLVATKCGLVTRLRCGQSNRFRCNYANNRCVPLLMSDPLPSRRRPFLPAEFAEVDIDRENMTMVANQTRDRLDFDYY